jgi:hypothetical protein
MMQKRWKTKNMEIQKVLIFNHWLKSGNLNDGIRVVKKIARFFIYWILIGVVPIVYCTVGTSN